MASQPVFNNLSKWIDVNKGSLKPPVCMKMMHKSQLKILIVGGPNERTDFHVDEGEELFYMIKGSMNLRVVTEGKFKDVMIEEGQIFLLPSRVAHSPQRHANSMGFVVERDRSPSEYDGVRWYVENSTEVLFERWYNIYNLESQLEPIFKEFAASEERKTGIPMEGGRKDAPFQSDDARKVEEPKSLRTWLNDHSTEINEKGYKRMFDDSYQTDVVIYGAGNQDGITGLHETFVWQIDGSRIIKVHGHEYELDAGDTLLIPSDVEYHARGSENSRSMFVSMNTHKIRNLRL